MKAINIFFFINMMIVAHSITAQDGAQGTTFGVIGGVNYFNLVGDDSDGSAVENDALLGFQGGVFMRIPLANQFYLQPGLLYVQKGAKNESDLGKITYRLSYAELPINFLYKAQVGAGSLLLGFGPYVAYGINGNVKAESGVVSLDNDIVFQNEVALTDPLTNFYAKRVDAGANIFFGYELAGGLSLQFNAQLGMLDVNPDDNRVVDDKTSIRNTGFGISLGYGF
jgi:Outer membrane protein beta-barrel domain